MGGKGGGKGKAADQPAQPAAQPADSSKVILGRDIWVPYEGKQVSLDDLHEMLRTLAPRMGDIHSMVLDIRKAIDAAHARRYELTDPETNVQHLEGAMR